MTELEIETWSELEPGQRSVLRAQICARLGDDWTLDGAELVHGPSEIEFVVVPGGTMQMGVCQAAEEQLRGWLLDAARNHALVSALLQNGFECDPDSNAPMAEQIRTAATALSDQQRQTIFASAALEREVESKLEVIEHARPIRDVRVEPFLCAREVWRGDDDVDPPSFSRQPANEKARQYGLRLPSEAELEWIVREGAPEQFMVLGLTMANAVPGTPFFRMRDVTIHGVADVYQGQWAADDWHDDYRGAPASATPWLDGDAKGVTRSGCDPRTIMDHDALVELLCGARSSDSRASLRLAHDIPTDPELF